jgi:hypothetical protein
MVAWAGLAVLLFAVREFTQIVGDRNVSVSPAELVPYAHDVIMVPPIWPFRGGPPRLCRGDAARRPGGERPAHPAVAPQHREEHRLRADDGGRPRQRDPRPRADEPHSRGE